MILSLLGRVLLVLVSTFQRFFADLCGFSVCFAKHDQVDACTPEAGTI